MCVTGPVKYHCIKFKCQLEGLNLGPEEEFVDSSRSGRTIGITAYS
jgi:hypothetical protein